MVLHDHLNAEGVSYQNQAGLKARAHGDHAALSFGNRANRTNISLMIAACLKEFYSVLQGARAPHQDEFAALKYFPSNNEKLQDWSQKQAEEEIGVPFHVNAAVSQGLAITGELCSSFSERLMCLGLGSLGVLPEEILTDISPELLLAIDACLEIGFDLESDQQDQNNPQDFITEAGETK